MEKECEACGKIFVTDNSIRKYCNECGKRGWHIRRQVDSQSAKIGRLYSEPKIHICECQECKKIIKAPFRLLYHKEQIDYDEYIIFCSKKCHGEYLKRYDSCKECGKQLSKQAVEEYDPFVKDTHFCSNECRSKFNRRIYEERGWIHKCENCGKEFIRDGGWFCSRECCIEAKRNGWKKPEPVEEKVEWFNT